MTTTMKPERIGGPTTGRPAPSTTGRQPGALLDGVLPAYEFRGAPATVIHAPPAAIFRALRELTLIDLPLARLLIWLRYVPGRLTGHVQAESATEPIMQQALRGANILLAEAPGQEVVVGVAGKLHNLTNQQPVKFRGPEEFARFDHPDYQKWVMSVRIAGGDGAHGYTVVAEHRIHALSVGARRKFAAYWLVIKPSSAVMLRTLLRAVKKRAERDTATTRTDGRRARTTPYNPARLTRFVNRALVPRLAALGLTPRTTVALEVRGRRSGKPRSVAITWAEHAGGRYFVSLAGESEWVRNVRAAGGAAVIRHGGRRAVRLVEVPVAGRAPVLKAYLSKWAATKSPAREAREYFGLRPYPSLEELEPLAARFPVFRIRYR